MLTPASARRRQVSPRAPGRSSTSTTRTSRSSPTVIPAPSRALRAGPASLTRMWCSPCGSTQIPSMLTPAPPRASPTEASWPGRFSRVTTMSLDIPPSFLEGPIMPRRPELKDTDAANHAARIGWGRKVSRRRQGMAEEYKNYIGGKWVPASSGETFESRNPADRDEIVGVFPHSGPEDVDAAVQAAEDAYRDWMMTPVPERADYLMRAGLVLEKRKDDLAELMTREMGKTLKESRGDVQEGIDFLFYIAGEGRRFFGHTMPSELKNKFSMTVRHP